MWPERSTRCKTNFIEEEKRIRSNVTRETASWQNKMAARTPQARLSPTATPRVTGSVGSSVRFGPHILPCLESGTFDKHNHSTKQNKKLLYA